ncbi:MAG: permease, partial [Spirochaetota bacterium]|nr:permease [Spirochaetota bacterium]
MDHVFGVFIKIYEVAKDAGIYIFIGFIFAGFVKAFIKTDSIVKNLGANKISSVIKASLLGIPLPLCSCSVIPVAYSLKKKGASNGAVTSFLISTPETGIDSITLSYALLDPILTIFRPLAAFITSIFAGFFQNVFDKNNNTINDNHNPTCCTKADCKDNTNLESSVENKNWWVKCWYKNMEGVKYAFTDLLPSIANTLAYGILLTGLLSYFIPIGYFSNFQY